MESGNTRRGRRRRSSFGVTKALAVIVFLIASLFASSATAIPLSRSLKSMDAVIIPDAYAQTGSWKYSEYEEGRKLIGDTNDYGGTGANDKHDPPRRR
ncbi:hypothetical protein V2J09_018939 [Rumex salicifolius]